MRTRKRIQKQTGRSRWKDQDASSEFLVKDQEKKKRICIVERVKERSERGNTASLRYGRGGKRIPETDRKKLRSRKDDRCQPEDANGSGTSDMHNRGT